MTFDLAALIASFLGGSLFTAVAFVFAFTNKMSSMSTTLTATCKKIDEHIDHPPVCAYHQQIENDVAVLKSQGHQVNWK